jgi:hypothetical protein
MLGRLHYNSRRPPAPLERPQTRLMVSIIIVSEKLRYRRIAGRSLVDAFASLPRCSEVLTDLAEAQIAPPGRLNADAVIYVKASPGSDASDMTYHVLEGNPPRHLELEGVGSIFRGPTEYVITETSSASGAHHRKQPVDRRRPVGANQRRAAAASLRRPIGRQPQHPHAGDARAGGADCMRAGLAVLRAAGARLPLYHPSAFFAAAPRFQPSVQTPGSGAGEDEIKKYKAVQDGGVTAIELREEPARRVAHEIGERHFA